jgi:hypothetical protein
MQKSIIEEVADMFACHEGDTGNAVRVIWLTRARFERLREAKDVWRQPYVYPPRPAERRRRVVGRIWGSRIKITRGKERTE